jgi:NADPH:quinone reductase-like Zn-dependent oxidoreductase
LSGLPESKAIGPKLGPRPPIYWNWPCTIAFQFAQQSGVKTEGSGAAATAEVLAAMADLVASGTVTVPIAATYPLDQVRAAYTELKKRHTRGKIVLIP